MVTYHRGGCADTTPPCTNKPVRHAGCPPPEQTMPPAMLEFEAAVGWQITPFNKATVKYFNDWTTMTVQKGQPIVGNYSLAPPDGAYYIVRWPAGQQPYINWYVDVWNSGTGNDQVFDAPYTESGLSYMWTRVIPAFIIQSVTYSI